MTFFAQNIQFKRLDTYLKQGLFEDATKFMHKWQDAYLAMFQLQFPEHRQTLSQDVFSTFWQHRRDGINFVERPGFHFMAQKSVSDADFVIGYVFYLLALKSHKKGDEAEYKRYVEQAVAYSSFHGAQLLLQQLMKSKTSPADDFLTNVAELLLGLHAFSDRCGCPGYLLLANGYLYLATLAKKAGDSSISEVAFEQVWKYLHLARLAKKDSSVEINNYYLGAEFEIANPFKLDSIEKMLDGCKKLAGTGLMLPQQNFIKNEATREYHELIKARDNVDHGSQNFAA